MSEQTRLGPKKRDTENLKLLDFPQVFYLVINTSQGHH